jgi:hypothetical protein
MLRKKKTNNMLRKKLHQNISLNQLQYTIDKCTQLQ